MTITELACTSCGKDLPPDSRFCNRCGAPTVPAATSAECKRVTVLFTEVVQSMTSPLSSGQSGCARSWPTSPTDVQPLYGGTVDKFTSCVLRYCPTAAQAVIGVNRSPGTPLALTSSRVALKRWSRSAARYRGGLLFGHVRIRRDIRSGPASRPEGLDGRRREAFIA
jgi:hypothetical protein